MTSTCDLFVGFSCSLSDVSLSEVIDVQPYKRILSVFSIHQDLSNSRRLESFVCDEIDYELHIQWSFLHSLRRFLKHCEVQK